MMSNIPPVDGGKFSSIKRYSPWILRIAGLACLVMLAVNFNLREALKNIGNVPLPVFALVTALTFLALAFKFFRWRLLTTACVPKLHFLSDAAIYLQGVFWGLASPGRVGELVKCEALRRDHGLGYGAGFVVMAIDRVFDILALAVMAALSVLVVAHLPGVWNIALLVLVALLVLLAWLMKPVKSAALLMARWPATAGGADCLNAIHARLFSRRGGAMVIWTALSMLVFVVQARYFLYKGFGLQLEWGQAVLVISVFRLASILPLSIMGIGVNEVLILAVSRQWFPEIYAPEQLIAFSLSINTLLFLPCLIASSPFALRRKRYKKV